MRLRKKRERAEQVAQDAAHPGVKEQNEKEKEKRKTRGSGAQKERKSTKNQLQPLLTTRQIDPESTPNRIGEIVRERTREKSVLGSDAPETQEAPAEDTDKVRLKIVVVVSVNRKAKLKMKLKMKLVTQSVPQNLIQVSQKSTKC